MSEFRKIYSIENNGTTGSLEELLNSVKSANDVKIGLQTDTYEEIIPFINLAYCKEFVCGIVPYQKSSSSIKSFLENKKYNHYNSVFVYFVDKTYAVLRSNLNGEPLPSDFRKSNYKYYNWFSNSDDWRLVFKSHKDFENIEKKKNLINFIKNGAALKIKITLKDITYIVIPTIIYFTKKNGQYENLSIKTFPLIIFDKQKISEMKNFNLHDLMINLNGEISSLSYMNYPISKKRYNYFTRAFNLILRFLNINYNFIEKEKVKHYKFTNSKVEWFIKN